MTSAGTRHLCFPQISENSTWLDYLLPTPQDAFLDALKLRARRHRNPVRIMAIDIANIDLPAKHFRNVTSDTPELMNLATRQKVTLPGGLMNMVWNDVTCSQDTPGQEWETVPCYTFSGEQQINVTVVSGKILFSSPQHTLKPRCQQRLSSAYVYEYSDRFDIDVLPAREVIYLTNVQVVLFAYCRSRLHFDWKEFCVFKRIMPASLTRDFYDFPSSLRED